MSMDTDPSSPELSAPVPNWGANAPKGAKSVFSRIIKDGANVPLFLSQTLVSSMRDVGYNNTTSAICEFVDNSIQAGATEIRVYFTQHGRRGSYQIDSLVYDNGAGMSPNVLRASMAFGGSMHYDNRDGIARYGMGLKAAALSMGPALEVYSWQEASAYYHMVLDTEAIGNDRSNVVYLPDARLNDELPAEIRDLLTSPMTFPRDADDQVLLADGPEGLTERLGRSGTILYIPDCDRLTYRKAQTLVEHAIKEFARVYRRQIADGLSIYVNNRLVELFDPTYSLPKARHVTVPEIEGREKRSRLVRTWTVEVPVDERSRDRFPVTMRLYLLPVEDWSDLPRKVLKNDLRVFDGHIVSYMRGQREVHSAATTPFTGKFHTGNNWWRLEVEFPGELDEAFGININKQGVRPRDYVSKLLKAELHDDLTQVKETIKRFWATRASKNAKGKLSEAEKVATEAEALQSTLLPEPEPKSEEERQALDAQLRTLAMALRSDGETEDEALHRVKSSRYLTTFKHDPDATFYRVDNQLGKVILTLNTAHPFFERVYSVLSDIANSAAAMKESSGDEGEGLADPELASNAASALVSLQLVLLSLARTQAAMAVNDKDGHLSQAFEALRRQWSLNLHTQLSHN